MRQKFYFKSLLIALFVLFGGGGAFADTYELYSGAITEGDYLLVSDDCAMNTTVSSNRLQFQAVQIVNSKITTGTADFSTIVWTITKSGNYYTLYNASAGKYAASTGTRNQAGLLDSGIDDKSLWTISGTDSYEFVNKYNDAHNINKNLRKNGTYGFACYATSTGSPLKLYKKVTSASLLSSIAVEGYKSTFHQGDSFEFGGTVTATYEDGTTNDVTNLATFSEPDMTTVGEKEITVSYTEREVTKTVTYKITVTAPAELTSITLGGNYPTVFSVGGVFSHEGMTVTANYDDNTTEDVTSSATFSEPDMTTAGTKTVTVSYTKGEVTLNATYNITVNAVSVKGITLNMENITIDKGNTKTLTATIIPSNATNKDVQWSSSDENVATVEDGVVTAVGEGYATITATADDNTDIQASCTVTVVAASALTDYYKKVTSTPTDWSGEYLIVYETGNVALNGELSTLDGVENSISVIIEGNKIAATETVNAAAFTIAEMDGGYSIKAASGKYIGVTSYSNGLSSSNTAIPNSLSIDDSGNAEIKVATSNGDMTLRYNNTTGQLRFRYYTSSGQQAIQLYKKTATLSYDPTEYTVTIGDDFETPILHKPANYDGTITFASSNTEVAEVDVNTGDVTIKAVGEATITASGTATENFEAATASYKITVKMPETAISFEKSVVEITYGDNYNKQAATTEAASSDLVYTSSDESIVKFHGNNVIDVLGPGTVTITATAPATETTSEGSATYTLKVYAPADAVEGATKALNEDFHVCDGTNTNWGGSGGFVTVPTELGWETTSCQAGPGYLKLGSSGSVGSATSPAFSVVGEVPLSFDLAPWVANNTSEEAKVTVTLTNAKFDNGKSSIELNTKDLTQREFTTFDQYKIEGNSDAVRITFSANGTIYNRYFLDNVVVGGSAQPAHEINLKFSSAGYLTWVATADIDFEATEGVTAYQITEATPQGITAEEVQKAPKDAALLLKGSGTVQLKRTSDVAPLQNNKMLACTDTSVTGITGNATSTYIYVLGNGNKGLGFYMLSGTLQAGKGYLNISVGAGAKPSFITFEETTGISNAAVETTEDDGTYFNLQGVRVMNPQKGIYIKNGKKIVVK